MKKMFLIICVAVSALAVTTSANVNKHQLVITQHSLTDTIPQDTMNRDTSTTDTMHIMSLK
jgi:hypothetical protein